MCMIWTERPSSSRSSLNNDNAGSAFFACNVAMALSIMGGVIQSGRIIIIVQRHALFSPRVNEVMSSAHQSPSRGGTV